ncbi:unnamed protein product [Didymodactylos carnosus]|uniref:glutathione transferase n=1 Tax=Didymodactylos carnosus TaxID=1234261 RepID=A0A8S2EIM9_9BILA|nr:unnamed protein product [Didymodactylos carnosus]CAF3962874.1 unnamed protein product [Didymodactylos carnosus]
MSTYKLYYFNGRGRAEVCRLIFAAAGQKFEDIRYEFGEWAAHKAETPLGQIPVLEVDGVQLPQSLSIARFLAKQFQLAGIDNFEQAKVDAVVDTMLDLQTKVVPVRLEKDEAKKQELAKKVLDEELPKYLKNLDDLGKLYGDGGPYFVGNKLTWADLYFHHCGQTVLDILGKNCLDNYAWLRQNRAEVEKQPRIAEYLKNRPKTPF